MSAGNSWETKAANDDPLRLRALLTLGPAQNDHWVALRCALGGLLPLLTLLALGRLDLAPFAVFGGLTNIFGRVPGHVDRLLAQLKVGSSLWLVMLASWLSHRYLIDMTSPAGPWVLVGLIALVSGVVAAWAGFLRIRPVGSLFHIFAFGGIASLPTLPPLGDGMFVAAATVGLALTLGQLGRLWPEHRTPWTVTPPQRLTAGERRGVWFEALVHGLAPLFAGIVAIVLQPVLGVGHLYWAMMTAAVPIVGHSTRHRVARGVHRILGSFSGVAVLSLIMLLHLPTWVTVLLIAGGQFGAEMFMLRNYFIGQTFVTPMALLGISVATGLTPRLMYDRLVETFIGAVTGMGAVITIALVRRYVRRLRDDADEPTGGATAA